MTTAERFQRLQELFHAALKLPPAERQSFLRACCEHDESLRRQVESLLAEDANPSGFLKPGELSAALSVGTRLGCYVISAAIGAGGMGQVYRGRDTKLNRDVAVKVLPEGFANDPERISRFQPEAQLLAALNHPNIAVIHGLEESNGTLAIIMELVEGPTLAERIAQGAVPLHEALSIAKQIGGALSAAHDRGIVHRDLKPANVKITPDGAVKVLDFGLAKALKAGEGDPENSPTITAQTQAGVILGTAAYMSPEQARGAAVDKRADIWAFGVVLYEMLTGERLFTGETISDTFAAVLTKEPELDRVPVQVRRVLRRCLERDPKRRLRDIADAWDLLEDTPQAVPVKGGLFLKIAVIVLGVVSAVALVALWRTGARHTIPESSVQLDLDLGPDVRLASPVGPALILSPDGNRIVLVSQSSDGTNRLLTRKLDEAKLVQLPGTDGAYSPFFSPDSQWVGFFAQGKLKKTRVEGGEPVSLCEAPAGRGGSWNEDGNIIAALDQQSGLSQVAAQGGKPVPITDLRTDTGEFSHRWPQVLPDGKAVLFTVSVKYSTFDDAAIAIVSLNERRPRILLEHAGMYPRYLPSGHLLYVTKGALFAVPIDLRRLQVRGPATVLAEGVACNRNIGDAQFDFSQTGMFMYRTGITEGLRTMQWLDAAGNTVSLGLEPASYISPRLSPDGTRVAYIVNQGANADLWIYDWRRDSKSRLATGQNAFPVWTPDGRFVVFQAAGGIFWTRSDGAGRPQPLTHSKSLQLPTSFSPDGTQLVFGGLTVGSGAEIRIVPVQDLSGQLRAGESRLFLPTSTINNYGAFSPDGRWLAYASAEGGRYEVYVRAFPDNGTQVQVSNTGGILPMWSRTANELFYRTEDGRIMVATYAIHMESFVVEKPRLWSGKQLSNVGLAVNFDLAPDGKRFLVLMSAEGPQPKETQNHVKIATHFFNEVRRRTIDGAK